MPKAAVVLSAVDKIAALDDIAGLIVELAAQPSPAAAAN